MKMIVQQVKMSTPLAAFNGGMFVEPETMKVLVQQTLDAETAQSVIERCRRTRPGCLGLRRRELVSSRP